MPVPTLDPDLAGPGAASQILGMTTGAASRSAFTDKISGQFRDQYQASGTAFGWQCIEYPKQNLLMINVPILNGASSINM